MKRSATYWVNAIKTLKESIKTCQPQNVPVYKKALLKANQELTILRRRAGVYC